MVRQIKAFIAICVGCGLALFWQSPMAEAVREIRQASIQFTIDGQQSEPISVSLPFRWDKTWPSKEGSARILLELPMPANKDEPVAIFIPRAGNQVEISAIEEGRLSLLTRYGDLKTTAYDAAKGPLWLQIPAATFKSSTGSSRLLEVKLKAQSNRYAGLSTVYVGPVESVRPLFDENYRWRQTSTIVIVLSLGLMGFVAAGIWWQQSDAVFGLFAIASLMGMIRMADRIMPNTFIPWPTWGGLAAIAFSVHILFLVRLAFVVSGHWNRGLARPFNGLILVSCVAAIVSFVGGMPVIWTAMLGALGVLGLCSVYLMVRSAMQSRSREVLLILGASLLLVAAGIRDFVAVRIAAQSDITYSVLPMADFLLVLAIGWVIVERYSLQVRRVETLNSSLEERITTRELALQQSYDAMREQSNQNATLQERARIMRDIHDGVGAQLVGLINEVKKSNQGGQRARNNVEVERLASSALDELRMAVDALQPVEGDLATVLATLRYRLQPRLTQAGIEVEWLVDELPSLSNLTPSAVLEVQRIILEAITNILQHAKANKVTMVGQVVLGSPAAGLANSIRLRVSDDGVGLQRSGALVLGHGLKNMAVRAEAIGAQLTIAPGAVCGTDVTLEWTLG
jgi:signal transduction histidine kinase